MAGSREGAPLGIGFVIGAWLQAVLGLALVVWAMKRSSGIMGLMGAFVMLRGIASVQRYRTAKQARERSRMTDAIRTFR